MALHHDQRVNSALIQATAQRIAASLDSWDQGTFADAVCGTTFCFAGHALLLSGYTFDGRRFYDPCGDQAYPWLAAELQLGLTPSQSRRIFFTFPDTELEFRRKPVTRQAAWRLMCERITAVTGVDVMEFAEESCV